jgi:hypothetical protein
MLRSGMGGESNVIFFLLTMAEGAQIFFVCRKRRVGFSDYFFKGFLFLRTDKTLDRNIF